MSSCIKCCILIDWWHVCFSMQRECFTFGPIGSSYCQLHSKTHTHPHGWYVYIYIYILSNWAWEKENIDFSAVAAFPQTTMATVLHVTSCQDEFRQQQIAMLWRASGATHTQVPTWTLTRSSSTVCCYFYLLVSVSLQRHLVCRPVKTPGSHISAAQYLQ